MTISVIIPVFREELLINETIARIESAECDHTIEIIVVDGSPGAETLRGVPSNRIKGIVSEKGRGKQMNAGAWAASGDILVFLHVDTELPKGWFKDIVRSMESATCVGGAFNLAIADPGWAFRVIERLASLRSRFTRIPYGDQAIFMRRDYFLEMGGYKDFPIMEDVDLMRRTKKRRGRICLIDCRVKTSSRRWKKEGVFRCTLRNRTIMLLYRLGVAPERLAKWYS